MIPNHPVLICDLRTLSVVGIWCDGRISPMIGLICSEISGRILTPGVPVKFCTALGRSYPFSKGFQKFLLDMLHLEEKRASRSAAQRLTLPSIPFKLSLCRRRLAHSQAGGSCRCYVVAIRSTKLQLPHALQCRSETHFTLVLHYLLLPLRSKCQLFGP